MPVVLTPLSGSGSGNYLTVAEVRAFKVAGQTLDLTMFSDDDIEEEIVLYESIVENITNDKFYPMAGTYRFDGNGLTKLFFQPTVVHELVAITSVVELDIDGTSVLDTFEEGDDYIAYPYYLETTLEVDGDSPRRRFGTGGVWPKGQKNIKIEGTWGKATVPPPVKRAVMILTLESLMPGSTQKVPSDVTQAVWNDFTVTFKSPEMAGKATGFEYVDQLLQPYLNLVTLFQVLPDDRQTYDKKC